MRVVMVHGILDTGRKFRRMRMFLEQRGFVCLAPSLRPSDARAGLEELAAQLRDAIDAECGPEEPLALIGFSMGGMIARLYLQELGGWRRTRQFFAISAPMHGSWLAYLYPGRGAVQMRPGSALLRRLDAGVGRLEGIALRAYWTPFDLVILPPASAIWPDAETTRVPALCHPCMVWSRRVHADIARHLAGSSPA